MRTILRVSIATLTVEDNRQNGDRTFSPAIIAPAMISPTRKS